MHGHYLDAHLQGSRLGSREAYVKYLETAWPGTALRVEDDKVQLIRALHDQNALYGGHPDPALRRDDEYSERALVYERAL